mmetsp:Transcript_42293/g.101787  ORF Transcript_42293/g.101787 Transcript_42293/m.101787 type:complete len:216 (+) Transcript_42293:917-1564(+)
MGLAYANLCSDFHSLHWFSHASLSALPAPSAIRGNKACRECLQSPHRDTVGSTTLPNDSRRISMWIIPPVPSCAAARATGAYFVIAPVVRSSNRDPTATIRSASWMAKFAYAAPCIPSMCRLSGSFSSKMPMPWQVVVTGMRLRWASSRTSSGQSEAPWPTYRIGFLAPLISLAASSSCGSSSIGGASRTPTGAADSSIWGTIAFKLSTSLGRST